MRGGNVACVKKTTQDKDERNYLLASREFDLAMT